MMLTTGFLVYKGHSSGQYEDIGFRTKQVRVIIIIGAGMSLDLRDCCFHDCLDNMNELIRKPVYINSYSNTNLCF